ncbi:MAG: hypothetical protein H6603_04575 [Flavobacteriales bacterium]|nr:hypothetical protein [Flavobacteriales bacterium]
MAPVEIITPTVRTVINGDVVKSYTLPDVEINQEQAKYNVNSFIDKLEARKVFHMIVPNSTTYVSMNISEYGSDKFEELKKGEALVINNLGHLILAMGFAKARKGKYPIEIFETEEEALAWFEMLRNR